MYLLMVLIGADLSGLFKMMVVVGSGKFYFFILSSFYNFFSVLDCSGLLKMVGVGSGTTFLFFLQW